MGAAGRMGATVCSAVHADPELELVGGADQVGHDQPIRVEGSNTELTIGSGVGELLEFGPDVVVDFTVAAAARENVPVVAAAGVHAVVGTSGMTEEDVAAFESVFTRSNCLVAPNFAISAVLMIRFAELAAPFFDSKKPQQ